MSVRVLLFLLSFATVAGLHYIFIEFRLYDAISWLDIPVHFFMGAVLGLGLVAMSDLSFRLGQLGTSWLVSLMVLVFLVVAWEVFGYLYLGSAARPDYLSDTMIDIVAGLSGGIIGLYLGHTLAILHNDIWQL